MRELGKDFDGLKAHAPFKGGGHRSYPAEECNFRREKKNLNLGVKFPDLRMLATSSLKKKKTCEPNKFHLFPDL